MWNIAVHLSFALFCCPPLKQYFIVHPTIIVHCSPVLSKPNALAGLFQASVAYVYLDGKTRHTGLRSCYLFEKFSHQDCDGGSMAILDSLDADLSIAPGMQKLDSAGKQENSKADGSGIVWDFDRLGNLSFQLSGKKNTLIVAIDGTCAEAVGATGTSFLLNLVDPLSAAANSPISIGGIDYVCSQYFLAKLEIFPNLLKNW
ncbi:hypothetical protein V6N13_020479 [Hibiscus sabdariffa]